MPYFTSKYTTFFSFENDYIPTLELKAVTSITGGLSKIEQREERKKA